MAIEHARTHTIPKPWGVVDLRPWSDADRDDKPIGEIWYERSAATADDPSLLLKLLFTDQALSIQVHPDDAYARSIGLPHGKTEAWYILSAAPQAKVALGLKQRLTPQQLRQAIDDGSIADLVVWRAVSSGETIVVPAGTIHAIGAGLVIAEIQQRSDATFRLFDQGRNRELHADRAIAVADAGPASAAVAPSRLTDTRTLLVSGPHFTFEKIDLPPGSDWRLAAQQESWLLVIDGGATIGSSDIAAGEAVFAQSDQTNIAVGPKGLVCLVAYTRGSPLPGLLQRLGTAKAPTSLSQDEAAATNGHMETSR